MYPYELQEVESVCYALYVLASMCGQVMQLIDRDGSGKLELEEMEAVFGA
jgi:hypothetical protein